MAARPSAGFLVDALEAERGLIEEDIKDLEARIKELTDKLVEEEKGKK